ncbi:MAG: alpha/beta hydrolase [Anaerolineales bacterium]|jgi:pimeloyl-ACP methyl ester carboxylesterase|uniref:alpha/beta fold hydrolase n=1 Tax=Candidatus Villigracilis vicinus TaxID=3140679 RepID=UPI003134718C|nr:alpha/beta hydrolase [Anaerolineales bacterium]MBK9780330.1 alpha/beta hydrolase [Anaerolineales bacterium]
MSAIILDGSMVHYEALGRGRPIIFLHGWVGSWRYWINAMQAASTSFRAYAIDLFGFGDTMRSPDNYTIAKQALLLERFLNEMGIGKVALVGHDLGALVAFEYLKKHYESVDRMMVIGAPLQYELIAPRMRTAPVTELAEWLTGKQPEAMTALSDASKVDPAAISASMSSLQTESIFPHVRNFGVPCLFVYGANDLAFTTVPTQEINNLPIHMHQINLEGSGHFPMLDNVPQFNRLLVDFLALDSGVSPSELQMKEEWKRRVR